MNKIKAQLAAARKKLKRLQAIDPRNSKLRHRIKKLVTNVRYLRDLSFDGCPDNVTEKLYPDIVKAHRGGLIVTATTNGTHSSTSWHYVQSDGVGHAIDLGNKVPGTTAARDRLIAFQNKIAAGNTSKIKELFGPASYYYKNGVRYNGAFPGHGDHVHLAK